MRIAICGSANQGKSTFISDFLETWPMYKKSAGNYRNLVKEKNLSINKTGNKASQEIILNSLIDEAMEYKKTDNVIHDRCCLDNLCYTLWLAAHDLGEVDEAFVQKSILLTRQALHFYDIIMYLPKLEKYKIQSEDREQRETDEQYNTEIDNFFRAIQDTYLKNQDTIFEFSSPDGAPALIEIYGNREERLQLVKMYIDTDGGPFGRKSSDSLITLPSIEEQAMIDRIIEQNKK